MESIFNYCKKKNLLLKWAERKTFADFFLLFIYYFILGNTIRVCSMCGVISNWKRNKDDLPTFVASLVVINNCKAQQKFTKKYL